MVAAPAKTEAPVEAAAQKKEQDKPKLKGPGSLYKRGNIWGIGYSVRGKWFRESSGSDKEADAMSLLKRRWREVGKGRFIGPSEDRVTVDSLLDNVVDDYAVNRRRSARTLNWRLRHLRATFGSMSAIDVTEDLIERYKVTRLSEKTERGSKPVCRACCSTTCGEAPSGTLTTPE